jgi:hypothetical protein
VAELILPEDIILSQKDFVAKGRSRARAPRLISDKDFFPIKIFLFLGINITVKQSCHKMA